MHFFLVIFLINSRIGIAVVGEFGQKYVSTDLFFFCVMLNMRICSWVAHAEQIIEICLFSFEKDIYENWANLTHSRGCIGTQ